MPRNARSDAIIVEQSRKYFELQSLPAVGGFEEVVYVIDVRSFYVFSEGSWQEVGGGEGSGGAPTTSSYIVKTSDPVLSNEFPLASLTTGLLKVTSSTGNLSTAVAGTDYLLPGGNGSGLTSLNASSLASGTVSTARLGTGTPSASTYLRGDSTWATLPSGGVTDHGDLTGLSDDDHTQYLTSARADTWLSTKSTTTLAEGSNLYYTNSRADTRIAVAVGVSVAPLVHTHAASAIISGILATARLGSGTADTTTYLRGDGAWTVVPAGVTDHGDLVGLADDDHTQYLTSSRADIWLGTHSTTDLTEGTRLYYTNTRADARIAAAVGVSVAAFSHTHSASDITSGTLATARIGSGTADSTSYLRGDSTWATPPSGAPADATYIVQTPNGSLSGEQALSVLSTGLLKNTTSTGVLSIASAGTDYLTPTGNGSGLTALSASALATGTVNTARLGSGSASTSTYLRGDNTWVTLPSSAPVDAKYIVQTSDSTLTNEQPLAALATGLLKVTTTTGVLSTAAAGTDYLSPSGDGSGLTSLNASALASGTVGTARLGSGTPSTSNYLRGDGTWTALPAGGDVFTTSANTFTHGQVIQAASGEAALDVKAASNANLLTLRDSTNASVSTIDKDGYGFISERVFLLGIGTPVTTGNNKTNQLMMARAGKIVKCFINAKTVPTGSDLIIDLNKNGTSIWNTTQANRLKLVAGASTGTQTSFDTTTFAEGDIFSIDIDQVGSTIAGTDVTVQVLVLMRNG